MASLTVKTFKHIKLSGEIDPDLLDGCRRMDPNSQERLYKEFYGFALGICLRYARSSEEAAEVLNDGFYKVLSNIKTYTPGYSFRGWLRKIMVNASIDHLRKYKEDFHHVDISYVKTDLLNPEILSHLDEEVILKALQALPPSYRLVFNLHVIEGYKHEEIAAQLNISEGTSKSNLNVARTKLQKALSREFERKIIKNG